MPKEKTIIIYCTAPARNGKGGKFKIGQKLEFEEREKANHLLSTGRFTEDKEKADEAVEKAKAAESDKADSDSKDDEIAKLKMELAEAKKAKK